LLQLSTTIPNGLICNKKHNFDLLNFNDLDLEVKVTQNLMVPGLHPTIL